MSRRPQFEICSCEHIRSHHHAGVGHCDRCACLKYKAIGKRGNKYGAQRVAGFDSKGEHQRFADLALAQKAGLISELRHHPLIEVQPEGCERITYRADYSYMQDGALHVEDFKCEITDTGMFRIKAKLLKAKYPGVVLVISEREKRGRRITSHVVTKVGRGYNERTAA